MLDAKHLWRISLAICGLAMPCQAANIALDTAADAVYDDGWSATDNGGFGFAPWVFSNSTGSGSAGQFIFTSVANADGIDDGTNRGVGNDGDIDTPAIGGRSWGMFANGDASAAAIADRPLTGGELGVGESISVDMDNGFIDSGGEVGVFFGDGGGSGLGVFFRGGDTFFTSVVGVNGTYVNTTTSLEFADEGLNILLERTGADAGTLTATLRNGDTVSLATGFNFLEPVTHVSLVNRNSGFGDSNNAYFNLDRGGSRADKHDHAVSRFVGHADTATILLEKRTSLDACSQLTPATLRPKRVQPRSA